MIQQILKTKQGKWAIALASIAVVGAIGSISKGSTAALPGAAIFLVIAILLAVLVVKAIQNPPTLEDQGVHITQEALDAFKAYGTLPRVENCTVILTEGEQAVYACRAERVETKNRKIGTTGGGAGISFRVTKRVKVRAGGTGSKSVYGDVEMAYTGEFVVTTNRIVFIATSRSYEEKLSNISAVSIDNGCLAIMTTKDNYAMRMPLPEYPCEIIMQCIKLL